VVGGRGAIMSAAEIVTLAIILTLFAVGAIWEWRAERRAVADELKPAPFTQPLGIEPADPMVICPSCRGMGHHSLDLVPAKPPTPVKVIEHPDGSVDEVFTWRSAAGAAEHYRRECVFCQHTWDVPA